MNLRLHYFRAALPLSGRRALLISIAGAILSPVFAHGQYVGEVKKDSNTPTLRAVGVLEWTGEAGKPKFSRLVPVSIYDGSKLQDAGIYLSRPQPMALDSETEYQLMKNGRTVGIFDISEAGRQLGSWVGFGSWKPAPKPKQPEFAAVAPIDDAGDDDKPVLHRKHHPNETASTSGTAPKSEPPAPVRAPEDPDRPRLHKPSDTASNQPAPDPDRPTLHKPAAEKAPQPAAEGGTVSALPNISDPDRPRLIRGEVNTGPKVVPTLVGLPPDLQQMVAVSDAKTHPDHPWTYSWADPADQMKMKAAMEDLARTALGLNPPAPKPEPAARRSRTRRTSRHAAPEPAPAEPAPLRDEQFHVFELAYGTGATMVLTADTGGEVTDSKFVTLIAQPDLYGNIAVLLKSVTDGKHLDETPRMRLVDAVDALADNRGELLFELRGAGSRQFALYRVMRGEADRIFVTSAMDYGSMNNP